MNVDLVVPTRGRASLRHLLGALAAQGPLPGLLILVDDRPPEQQDELDWLAPRPLRPSLRILRTDGRGPAAARNAGWAASKAEWIAFLDDDVVPQPGWLESLAVDLAGLPPDVAASQGVLTVPLPQPATDWERNVGGLAHAHFITADMAFRRTALLACGGFDERFPRAFREDAEIACRLLRSQWKIVRGTRRVEHPVPAAGRFVSVTRQRGNADDALMRALHGQRWRSTARVPRGRRPLHVATSMAGAVGLLAAALGRRRIASAALAAWAVATVELTVARVRPGPRTLDELATMAITSPLLPPVATAYWLRGVVRWRLLERPRPLPTAGPRLRFGEMGIRTASGAERATTDDGSIMQLDSIQDVFADQLGDLRSAETQLLEALPKMADAASDAGLKEAFRHHLEQTRVHVRRLDDIIGSVAVSVPDEQCEAMKGLIAEGEEIVRADGRGSVKDVALIAAAQRVEHYEIAAYGTARALAKELDLSTAAGLLDDTLDEESDADKLLTKIAAGGLMTSGLNEAANR